MIDDLPFVHPPQDPSPERAGRALARARHAVHRQRVRRRVLATTPVAALVAVGALAAAGTWSDGDRHDDITVGAGPSAGLSIDADTPWIAATLSEDGRMLELEVGDFPDGTGPCEEQFRHELVETEESVTVGFERTAPTGPTTTDACGDVREHREVRIRLTQPLGDRAVYDGVQAAPRDISRLDEHVLATWLPAGFRAQGVVSLLPEWPQLRSLSQHFAAPGIGWTVQVRQDAVGRYEPPDGTTEPVVIHGIAGERTTDGGDASRQTIHWVEDGLDIQVRGDTQGSAPFVHGDELLQVAEGIRPRPR